MIQKKGIKPKGIKPKGIEPRGGKMVVVKKAKVVGKKAKPAKNKSAKKKTITYSSCHTGNIHCFDVGIDDVNTHFHGGGSTRGAKAMEGWVVIDLADRWAKKDNAFLATSDGFPGGRIKKWRKQSFARIDFFIRDGFAPTLPAEFYWDLLRDIADFAKARGDKEINVLVACIGGHGRTGTVLAVIAGLAGVSTGDPVQWLRDCYCEKAVESDEQIEYIAKITGLEVKAKARHIGGYGAYNWEKEQWVPGTGSSYVRKPSGVKKSDGSIGENKKIEDKNSVPLAVYAEATIYQQDNEGYKSDCDDWDLDVTLYDDGEFSYENWIQEKKYSNVEEDDEEGDDEKPVEYNPGDRYVKDRYAEDYTGESENFPIPCDFCGENIMDVPSLCLRRDGDGFVWILCEGCDKLWEMDGALWQ